MVDYQILKRMHKNKNIFKAIRDDLSVEAMESEQPPAGDFLALLPPYIFAFDLQEKSWCMLFIIRSLKLLLTLP